jgi:HK97 family phage prohead protease
MPKAANRIKKEIDMERMLIPLSEVKFAAPDSMEFSGYGAVFGNVDAYGDVIRPGAFAESLANARRTGIWPAMLSQHGGWGMTAQDLTPIGVWTDLSEDGIGLKATGTLAPTPRGQELHALMKMQPRPAIDGLSIGYIAKDWSPRSKPEEPRRTLKRIDLVEISPVTFPANGKARVTSVKSLADNERDFEAWLMRDAGLSRKDAQVVISRGFRELIRQRDAAGQGSELSELASILRRNAAAAIA